MLVLQSEQGCFQWFKDTKMKANHNEAEQIKEA